MSVFGHRVRITFWHLFLFLATAAFAADFVVINTNDSGGGSLRQAILDVNSVGSNTSNRILFAIPGAGVHRINVTSSLPMLEKPTEIDGTSQGDTSAGPLVELVGAFNNTTTQGFISFQPLTVRRLAIGGFFYTGIYFNSTGESYGNYLGLAADGTTPIPNNSGIVVTAPAIIGGNTTPLRNILSGNSFAGVEVHVPGSVIQDNYIGVGPDGTTPIPNGFEGIVTLSPTTILRNTIATNGANGVRVAATGVTILENSMFANTGSGIHFDFPGANNGQASPVLTSAFGHPSSSRIAGTLTSAPGEAFRLQFFSNPVAEQEGRTFLGEIVVITDGAGAASFDDVIPSSIPDNHFVTATATRNATGDTSQFSADLLSVHPGELAFTGGSFVTAESAGTVNLTLSRTGGSEGEVQVNLNVTGGTALAGTDFTAPATVTFPAGVTTASATIAISPDMIDELDETATFSISNPTNGAALGAQSTATLTINDDDTAGITVAPLTATTTEAGATANFTIVLNSQPTADVTIGLTSADTTEGTVSPSSVTFTPANWNVAQPVTVTGIDDFIDDGDVAYSILTAAATSGDGNYSGLNAADVAVTNIDDDGAGIIVGALSGNTAEGGGTAAFTVVLASQPSANVTIALASSNTAEGTVSPASLTFTPANWNVAQVVTLTGVDDPVSDGPQAYTIVISPAVSADPGYSGQDPADVAVTNADNETLPAITIGDATPLSGGPATFTVTLSVASTMPVSVNYATADGTAIAGTHYGAATGTLTFAAGEISQTITVPTMTQATGGQTFFVNLTAPVNGTLADSQGQATFFTSIPTLSGWMLMALIAMVAVIGAKTLRGA